MAGGMRVLAALRELAGLVGRRRDPRMRRRAGDRGGHRQHCRRLSPSVEQPCPHCGSSHASIDRKAQNLPERVRRNFSARRLFRCDDCSWRGWLLPLHFNDFGAVEPAAIPDLAALDVALQASAPTLRRSFSPRDLQ